MGDLTANDRAIRFRVERVGSGLALVKRST